MILEALGILKILDWATAGDRYQHQQPARFVEPNDAYSPPYAVEGGEVRIVTRWWGQQKQYYLEVRPDGNKKWEQRVWPWRGHYASCLVADMLKHDELDHIFSEVLHDPYLFKSFKEQQ